jgi:hypothetical protein
LGQLERVLKRQLVGRLAAALPDPVRQRKQGRSAEQESQEKKDAKRLKPEEIRSFTGKVRLAPIS